MANRRNLIMDCAQKLIAARGYHSASMLDVAREAGVTTAAIFHHFPSKAELVAATLHRACDGFGEALRAFDGQPAAARLAGWIDIFAALYVDKNLFCPCGMLAAERNGLPSEIVPAVERFLSMTLAWLTRAVRELRPSESDPQAVARAILAATEGGLLMTRMSGEKAHFRQTATELIEALIGAKLSRAAAAC